MLISPGAIALQFGPLAIRWYGVLMAVAIVAAWWVTGREARRSGLAADRILDASQWSIVAGLVGARIYEVIFNWDYYGRHLSKIPAVWEGGLAIHGGLIVGIVTGIVLARRSRLPLLASLDVAAPGIAIGQAIGRWGTFFNEEAFGTPTDLPWKLYISSTNRPLQYTADDFFHPAFLYESLWNLAVFATRIGIRRAEPSPELARHRVLPYGALYSVGRFLIEGDPDRQLLGSAPSPSPSSPASSG